ncbi:COMMD8 [Branchiostoma lanceolatum]|uniref:COMMD8 protein n=1 Tax=Branchiostoma lanceolatum TaxID=7740 RepID=A0A8K0ER77_BRALA|nr:COMMD8 [Branchiostoma lanceolatum]
MRTAAPVKGRTIMAAELRQDLLGKVDGDRFETLLHEIVDWVCRGAAPSYQPYSQTWDLDSWWHVLNSTKSFLLLAVKENLSKDGVLEHLTGLDSDHQQCFLQVITSRKEDIRLALISATAAISQGALEDLDWQVKLVLSSDKISSVQKPVLGLDLAVNKEGQRESLSLELSQEEVASLVTQLEAANKVVTQMKT